MGLREPPVTCHGESYLAFRFLVELLPWTCLGIGCNQHKGKEVREGQAGAHHVRGAGWVGRWGKFSRKRQEPGLPEKQQASVCGGHHPKQDPDNCDSTACCGHRETRRSHPGSCKGGRYTSAPPGRPSLGLLLPRRQESFPLSGEERTCFPDELLTSMNNALILSCIGFALRQAFLCAEWNLSPLQLWQRGF